MVRVSRNILLISLIILAISVSNCSGFGLWIRRLIRQFFGMRRRRIFNHNHQGNYVRRPPHPQQRPKPAVSSSIQNGPPFETGESGPLSFSIGRLRFRQPVYDFERNQKPFVLKPGPLSFRLGPFRFTQIPTQTFTFDPCCTDYRANCELFVNCDAEYEKR